jgi:hypothetical protein
VLRQFETVFSERVWEWGKVLLIGAILAPGERTVAAILRVMGCADEKQFQNYHRVLNRAKWSSRELSRRLLVMLVHLFFAENEPLIMGIDETIERRRGRKIAARGVYRDPVRSSKEFFVKTNGLRWISLMLLTPIPWAQYCELKQHWEPPLALEEVDQPFEQNPQSVALVKRTRAVAGCAFWVYGDYRPA